MPELNYKMKLDHVTKGAVCYRPENPEDRHSWYARKDELPNGKIPEEIIVKVTFK